MAAIAVVATMLLASACALTSGSGQGASPSAGPAASSVAGSSPNAETTRQPTEQPSKDSSESHVPCQAAPTWLTSAVIGGLAVHGATLSEVYVGTASITAGPDTVLSPSFAPAWWIVAKVSGASVRPEVAIWVTNRTTRDATGEIFAANPAALRYSTFGQGDSTSIDGDGKAPVVACLTPIPES